MENKMETTIILGLHGGFISSFDLSSFTDILAGEAERDQ